MGQVDWGGFGVALATVKAAPHANASFSVRATPVSLCGADDATCAQRLGRLRFERGWHLSAPKVGAGWLFGGLSDVVRAAAGGA